MLKAHVFVIIFLCLISSCALFQRKKPATKVVDPGPVANIGLEKPVMNTPLLIDVKILPEKQVMFKFKNLLTGYEHRQYLKKGLVMKKGAAGKFRLLHILIGNEKYLPKSLEETHSFEVLEGSTNYLGTILVGCPNVSEKYSLLLAEMNFFHRWTFLSKNKKCEVIVGHSLEHLEETSQFKKIKLEFPLRPAF